MGMNSNNRFIKEKIPLPGVHRWAAYTMLRKTNEIKQYARYYSCWPNCARQHPKMGSPPMVMIVLIFGSIAIWLSSFITSAKRCHFDGATWGSCPKHLEDSSDEDQFVDQNNYLLFFDRDRLCDFGLQEFIWDPYQTSSVWRYFTYGINSINIVQLITDVVIYTFLGVPFEMVFGSGRTVLLLICCSGVGAFASSAILPQSFILGGSVFTQFFLCANISSIFCQIGNTRSLEQRPSDAKNTKNVVLKLFRPKIPKL